MVVDELTDLRESRHGVGGTLRLLRVRDWLHFLPLPLVTARIDPLEPHVLLGDMLLAAGCLAFAYGWNDLMDRRLRSGPAGQGALEALPRSDLARVVGVMVATLAGAALAGIIPLAAAVLSLSGGALYSGGPRLKRVPVVGTLANAWIFVPMTLLGLRSPEIAPATWALLGAFLAVLLQNQLVHEASHAEDDRRDAIDTTFLTYGPVHAQVWVGLLGLAGIVCLLLPAFLVTEHSWVFAVAVLPLAAITAQILRPRALSDTGSATRLRRMHRYAGLLACGVAWAGRTVLLGA